MSSGQVSRQRSHSSRSTASKHSGAVRRTPPPASLTPESRDSDFEPCAATASFLLYAQRSQILVLHHDTLTIERRFTLHREDVLWIAVDNVSDRGQGRLAVSFDAGKTAIVWDILSGGEVARFSAYEHMRVASFMRNGNIAFANDQGNIILFEPSTSEHVSARTIFDPITAIAPAIDCRTFAIGYLNGSILIATLQPSFTILHTLNTTRSPARITDLAWHGSSSKQKTDMLATQTADGDLRVWSVPKSQNGEVPNIIRVLQRPEVPQYGPCWFAWSKNGRIVQYADGETRSWDVRTKKVTYEIIPTCDGITGLANYGPTATLFALGRNHAVFQYDINPSSTPLQVANAQHAPANTPPTPPTMLEERKNPYAESSRSLSIDQQIPLTFTDNESSADESAAMSPLQKIAREMDSLDALESEIRDKVMPLSPHSSRASSTSSKSSGRRRERQYLYDRPDSSRASSDAGYDGTEFSFGPPPKAGHESMSIRSVASSLPSASAARHTRRSSNLRKEVLRSPEESQETALMDLFPTIKARLRDVAFRTPHYGNAARTPDLLLSEMLSVVFGWNDDVRSLIQDELSRHRPGSAAAVLLAKWLGNMGADSMASMVGSESMTSSDWMLLALSSIGADSQKKVGEAFVQRLLEKGDIHPAVAILLGLGEHNDAIEVYVSQQYWLEAVLLTCLTSPSDWQRISYLIRKWGERAVTTGQPELAVRCFSCTSVETSEPWFSPRAQDAVYAAQQERFMQPLSAGGMTSPPLSPPSRSASGRMTAKNASLKLITSFGDKGAPATANEGTARPLNTALGVTPIAQSALSPGGAAPWKAVRNGREPSTARTATPGGYQGRKRLPSRDDIARAKQEAAEMATPLTAARDKTSRAPSLARRDPSAEPATALRQGHFDAMRRNQDAGEDHLPSPAQGVFTRLRAESRTSNRSGERRPGGLQVEIVDTAYTEALSPGPSTDASSRSRQAFSPITDGSTKSGKGRAIDAYISSVEEARLNAREERVSSRTQSRSRNQSRKRGESRGCQTNRLRDKSEARGRNDVRYIKPGKRSPSSPVPMSPEEIAQASGGAHQTEPELATTDDENFYKMNVTSPTGSHRSGRTNRKSAEKPTGRPDKAALIGRLAPLAICGERGRSQNRDIEPPLRSPSLPTLSSKRFGEAEDELSTESHGFRMRARSISRQPGDDLQSRRQANRARPERSSSRRPSAQGEQIIVNASDMSGSSVQEGVPLNPPESSASIGGQPRARTMTRKQIAAQELEARRRSLARRPSAPSIPLPGDLLMAGRPPMAPRHHTDLGESPTSYNAPLSRSHTVDPDAMSRYNQQQNKITGTSGPSALIGLPATPRAMRHPRYMSSDPNERDGEPPVPRIPGQYSELSSLGSSLSQVTGSALSQMSFSDQQQSQLSSQQPSTLSESSDSIGPLLPATVFGQKGQALPSRSASAPPEKQAQVHPLYKPTLPSSNRRMSGGLGHVRKISPPDIGVRLEEQPVSIDAALHEEDQVIIISESDMVPPPMLAELQHLAGPPPPPPPPTMYHQHQRSGSGVINIAIDEHGSEGQMLPMPMERAQTASPSQHRKNAPSGSWMRGFGDRMRSSSKSRTKSPPIGGPAPYETVLPPMPGYAGHMRRESLSQQRAQSPYEQAMAAQSQGQAQIPIPPPPPPAPTHGQDNSKLNETTIPPFSLPSRSQSSTGYRNPKEIRANMPPETLQQGVYHGSGGMI
ncbi:putative WD40/YVTN repeat-like-containing domain superfamily [Septoria linicola]|nr:putative WD40/YVTN repeat-like-containing domain superfamily [Septoria linicola]